MQTNEAALSDSEHALVRLAQAARDQGYRFITPTPATHERVNARPGNAWAADLRGVLGWSRPFKTGLLPKMIFELMEEAGILAPTNGGWRSSLRLSTLGKQLCWHSAHPTAEPDAVFFGPDTYRFVQAIKHHLDELDKPIERAFDIGGGTGAGALCIARKRPAAAVLAGDINARALRLARVNATIAGVNNLQVLHSNMLSGVDGDFDLVVANPPYLNDSLKRAYRHGGGRHGEELALAMLEAGLKRLAPGGAMLLYTGAAIINGQDSFLRGAQPVLNTLPAPWHWHYRELDPDVFGEELDTPAYTDAERIAAVLLQVQAP